jgi:hypothetical protein
MKGQVMLGYNGQIHTADTPHTLCIDTSARCSTRGIRLGDHLSTFPSIDHCSCKRTRTMRPGSKQSLSQRTILHDLCSPKNRSKRYGISMSNARLYRTGGRGSTNAHFKLRCQDCLACQFQLLSLRISKHLQRLVSSAVCCLVA